MTSKKRARIERFLKRVAWTISSEELTRADMARRRGENTPRVGKMRLARAVVESQRKLDLDSPYRKTGKDIRK